MCPICEVCVWISPVQTDWSESVVLRSVKLHDDLCYVPLKQSKVTRFFFFFFGCMNSRFKRVKTI